MSVSTYSGGRWPRGTHADRLGTFELPAELRETAIGQAAERVIRRVAEWRGDALQEGCEACDQVLHLCGAIRAADPGLLPVVETAGQQRLRRVLVDLLRRELLDRWSDASGGDRPDARQMLDTLQAVERVQRSLEPNWRDSFAAALSGPGALDLVVEVAHDLRSPLTSIMFLSETLQKERSGPINDIQRQQLGIIYSAALALVTVASDVIDMARGGDSLDESDAAPFSISELFTAVSDMVAPMVEQKDLRIRVLPPPNDTRVGHSAALSRVLLNLLTNAAKFTEHGLIEVTAREQGPDRVQFSVRDTGEGIRPDRIDEIYLPFRRRRDRSGYHFSGTGLGLSICRRMVEAMGGELEVETSPGWGTRFWFEVPMPRFDHPDREDESRPVAS